MYCLYEEYCVRNNITRKATESMYRTIFKDEFNMSSFQPKKDLYDVCHKYEKCSTEDKLEMEKEYQLHVQNKNLARQLKNADKE
ncbi:hypothetical protein NQ314_018187 [Rhamnusium bicolor]|uniref:Uncharacterized protein n=1 Tax=Rhamnusium bicolor TaxID=1586634 RepID=A0AAV8WRY1_9CUCU|nr:hypothetical protein NQ314_018187 [Rhamnusium bicolor]